ncbi:MAG TPA: Gfo/Idh/MocA family oxidoreductase [Parapedobacter sp.]|uniref:Gfo/Idh/MocA family protein n=1 Tax=Parapedobacter sp. TaxID=1958893 RepID=UPI002C397818|nr:Gfo/Idh/MocA family oxidoreductase [Parapedobacter sp.]HWK59697.1 Gfo/Idh/MocA family oxidoreductase [Parapedobacter sp.]
MEGRYQISGKGHYSRRQFVGELSLISMGGMAFASLQGLSGCASGSGEQTERQAREQPADHKLGIALVGLGQYSEGQLAPALEETAHCYLAGIVTGTPDKIGKWRRKYDIPENNVYNYENFDSITSNSDIDIVYVVLPNAMHAEYTIRALEAGKHVICEKPMAVTVADCDRMIAAAVKAGKMLSIGYRLHFEPHNMEMMKFGQEKEMGEIKHIIAENGMESTEGWRLDKSLAGGGPLMDVGIYCVQGARYTLGMEPIAVTAQEGPKTDPEMFSEVEESLTWQMEFPGGITALCKTSYSENMDVLRAEAEHGWAKLEPAYPYGGIKGETSEGGMDCAEVNQQAYQMDDFAKAIKESRPTPVPGEMGRQDVKILQAIYRAMESGDRVEISF